MNPVNFWDDCGVLKLHFNMPAVAQIIHLSDIEPGAWPLLRRSAVGAIKARCYREGCVPSKWQALYSPDGSMLAYACSAEHLEIVA